MKLKQAAKYFDRTVCTDAYGGSTTFVGQFGLFDDSTRDGITVERRVLSVAPGVVIPPRRVINAGGMTWIMGDKQPDTFKADIVREKYVVHVADSSGTIRSIQQLLQGAAGLSVYTALAWVKGSKQIEVSSDIFDVFDGYFAVGEPASTRSILTIGTEHYIVRTAYKSESGFLAAVVDKLAMPDVETATFSVRTYNPVADTYISTTSSLTVLRVRWQEHFEYVSRMTEPYQRGDLQAMVLKTTTPKVNDAITLSDGKWNVLSVADDGTYWSMHLRRT